MLLSIAWDHQKQPKHWCHAIFMGLNKTTIRIMSANNWDILFEDNHESSTRRNDDIGRIVYIHHRIHELSRQPTLTTEKSALPFVQMGKDLWQDHHSQVKIVAHVTFQEVTRPRYIS